MPDTSPRAGTEGEDDDMMLGTGASFYVDATQEPWNTHYQMFTYITQEFPSIVEGIVAESRGFSGRRSVMGHSMGGHGAIISFLRCPERYVSCSAFAPASNPSELQSSVFAAYLGDTEEAKAVWKTYDACEHVKAHSGKEVELLIDQGSADDRIDRLVPFKLSTAAESNPKVTVVYREQEGYTHDLACFVSTFVAEHIAWHADKGLVA